MNHFEIKVELTRIIWGETLDTGDMASYSVSILSGEMFPVRGSSVKLSNGFYLRFSITAQTEKHLQLKSRWNNIRFNVMIIVRENNSVSQFSQSVEAQRH